MQSNGEKFSSDEALLRFARLTSERLDMPHWRRVTILAREITRDRATLDDIPAVALALRRARALLAATPELLPD